MATGSISGRISEIPKPQGIKSVYDAAASQQGEDYDKIMQGYDQLLKKSGTTSNTKLNYVPINAVFNRNIPGAAYQRSSELGTALSGLEDYSKTGGYSDADIQNIRERGISPIRSIYDAANRNMQRQKVLQGGYSPNFGAIQSKMARESTGQIGDITTRVNADIAERVAQGKLAGLNSLGSIAGQENTLSNQIAQRNSEIERQTEQMNAEEQRRVDTQNQQIQQWINEFNNRNQQQGTQNELAALGGQSNLYGTTPALTQTFGNQVLANNEQNMQAVNIANQIKNQRANIGLNLVNSQLGRRTMG